CRRYTKSEKAAMAFSEFLAARHEMETGRQSAQAYARSTSFSPKRIAASESSCATNSTISFRSAIALSVIRTLKSIAESCPLLLQWDGHDRLRHLPNRALENGSIRFLPFRCSSRTIQPQ